MLPLTFLFAPIAMVLEAMPVTDSAFRAAIGLGGPVLFGSYAVLLNLPSRLRHLAIACTVHGASFLGAVPLKQGYF
jgi:hypothetical protein